MCKRRTDGDYETQILVQSLRILGNSVNFSDSVASHKIFARSLCRIIISVVRRAFLTIKNYFI